MTATIADARRYERLLWGISLRMTGCAADADDVVQETYARFLSSPPTGELKPWLTTVAVNASRDVLRRRKRAPYDGPWLPSPIDEGDELIELEEPAGTEQRYELLESVSVAFLLALEKLTSKQRAVVVLVDVIGHTTREAAETLGLSEGAVKVLHHRARKHLEAYEATRPKFDAGTVERHRVALEAFLTRLMENDVEGLEAMMASDVSTQADANGESYAGRKPVHGPQKVALFMKRITEQRGAPDRATIRVMSGRPAVVAEWDKSEPMQTPRTVMALEVDADGKIVKITTVQASRKLKDVRPV